MTRSRTSPGWPWTGPWTGALAATALSLACVQPPVPNAPAGRALSATEFLEASLQPWPHAESPGLIAITDPSTGRVSPYDSALVVLALLRAGDRQRAGSVVRGLAALQQADGGLPFSFTLPRPDSERYERSGTVAWVGYAAVEYLDAADGGDARAEALALARRAAEFLLSRQVNRAGDPRDGLVLGGVGTVYYVEDRGDVHERYEPGEVAWASVEHNVDTYFFLRSLARITDEPTYTKAAERIARALRDRGWSADDGQLVQGFGDQGVDPVTALDCASWGSVFLGTVGEVSRADTAAAVADERYASLDPRSGARGHRPYASGPVIENVGLLQRFARQLPATTWDRLEVVWPEGSAGVAFAELRAGHAERARSILDQLEALRARDGSLPTSTVDVPFTLDMRPSIAGTAWVELVRFELDRPPGKPTLWP
jgi:hypothetical protein